MEGTENKELGTEQNAQEQNVTQEQPMSQEQMMSLLAGYETHQAEKSFTDKDVNTQHVESNQEPTQQHTDGESQEAGDEGGTAGQQQATEEQEGETKKPSHMVDITKLPLELQEYIIESSKEGFNRDEYALQKRKEQELLSLNNKDFYKLYLKQNYGRDDDPNKLSDEDIENEIASLTPFQLKNTVDGVKKQFLDAIEKQRQDKMSAYFESKNIYSEEEEKNYNKLIDDTIERNKDRESVFGIPISQAERKEIDAAFREFTKIDPKTGMSEIEKILQDDDMLYQVTALLFKGEDNLKGKVRDIKEGVKQSIIDKLGVQPESIGTGTSQEPKEIDYNILL